MRRSTLQKPVKFLMISNLAEDAMIDEECNARSTLADAKIDLGLIELLAKFPKSRCTLHCSCRLSRASLIGFAC